MKCHPSVFSYLGVKNSLKFSYKAKAPTLTLSAGKEETSTSGRSEVPQVKPDLGDPAQTVVWGGRLPSRRRAITGGLTGLAIGESLRLAAPASVVNLQSIIGISRGREVAATCPAVQMCSRAQHSTQHKSFRSRAIRVLTLRPPAGGHRKKPFLNASGKPMSASATLITCLSIHASCKFVKACVRFSGVRSAGE